MKQAVLRLLHEISGMDHYLRYIPELQRVADRDPFGQPGSLKLRPVALLPFTPAFIITAILFSFNLSFGDQPLTRSFDNSRNGFSISFPDGWAQMPPEKLENANQTSQAQHPEWKHPLLQYGYQRTNFAGLPFPPYVLIRVSDTGHAPDPEAVRADMEKDSLPQGAERTKPFFDQELNAFLLKFKVEFSGVPPIDGSVAYFLTKRGIIKMFFYVPKVNDQHLADLVQQIIQNVRISDEMKLARDGPASRVGLIVALLAMGVIAIVLSRAKPTKYPGERPVL